MSKTKLGLALCGSYCTYAKVMEAAERLCREYEVTAVISEKSAVTDTRFGEAEVFVSKLEELTGKPVIDSIVKAEQVGPGKLFDVLVVAPCTGNTLAKIANGITDSSVTMAVKAHIRNGGPVVLAISTNDGLGASAKNIGELLTRKNIYFVPFYQDDCVEKPNSLVADLDQIEKTAEKALEGKQIQPLITVK